MAGRRPVEVPVSKASFRSLLRWFAWIGVISTLTVAASAAGALYWLHTALGREWLRQTVEGQLRSVLPGLALGGAAFRFPDGIAFTQVIARDEEGRIAVQISNVQARVDLRSLMSRRFRVRDLAVAGPRVSALQTKDGQLNLARLVTSGPAPPGQPSQAKAPWSWEVSRFTLAEGVLDWQVPYAHAEAVDATGSVGYQSGHFHATVRLRARGHYAGWPLALRLEASGGWIGQAIGIQVQELAAEGVAEGGAVSLRGRADGPPSALRTEIQASLPGQSSVHLDSILRFADHFAYQARIAVAHLDPRLLQGSLPSGTLNFNAEGEGRGIPFTSRSLAAVQLHASDSRLVAVGPFTARLKARLDGHMWNLEHVAAHAPGIELTASGHGQERRLAVRLDAEVSRPQQVHHFPHGLRGKGRAHVQADILLPATIERIDARVHGVGLSYSGRRADSLDMTISGSGHLPAFQGQARLHGRGISLGAGTPTLDDLSLELGSDGQHFRLSGAAEGKPGKLSWEASGTATTRTADITLNRLQARSGQALVTLQQPARIEWRRSRRLSVHGLRLSAPRAGSVAADAVYTNLPREGRQAELHIVAHRIYFSSEAPLADADVLLRLRSDRLQADARVDLGAVQSLRASGSLPVSWRSRESLPALVAKGAARFRVVAKGIRLDELPKPLLARLPLSAGLLDLAVDGSGEIEHPVVQLNAELSRARWRDLQGISAQAKARLGADSADFTLRAQVGQTPVVNAQGQIRANVVAWGVGVVGRLSRPRTSASGGSPVEQPASWPLDIQASLPGVELGRLAEVLPALAGSMGMVTGHAHLTGSFTRPSLDLALAAGQAQIGGVNFSHADVQGSYHPGSWQMRATAQQGLGGSLDLAMATTPGTPPHGRLEVKSFDIAFLTTLVPDLVVSGGKLDASLSFDGLPSPGDLSGILSVRDGQFGIAGQPTFKHIELTVSFEGQSFEIRSLRAELGRGQVSASGRFGLLGWRLSSLEARLQTRDVPLATETLSGSKLDLDLQANGVVKEGHLDLSLVAKRSKLAIPRLETGRSLQSLAPLQGVTFVGEPAKPPAQKEAPAILPGGAHIRMRADDLEVRGQDFQGAFRVELELDLERDQTRLGGQVTAYWGTVYLLSHRYTVEHANLMWNKASLDPALDIELSGQFPEVLVTLWIRGSARTPQLTLASNPPTYSKGEIMSLVLTGHLPTSPGGAGDLTSAALSAVSSTLIGSLAQRIAPALGGGVFRINMVTPPTTQPPALVPQAAGPMATRVEIGKNLSDRIYVGFSHIFGAGLNENPNAGRIEYRMSRSWVLQSEYGDAGVGGFDLLWMRRY